MNNVFPFKAAADAAPATWVVERLRGFAESVVSVVPAGFAAYARVYHPAWRGAAGGRTATRWAEVARATSRTAHRQMQWFSILGRYQEVADPGGASFDPPHEGTLPLEVARPLQQILALHNTAAEQCWFAVWEGFGCLRSQVQSAPAFDIPNRRLHLFSGSIAAITASFCEPPFDQSANLWWPADHAWCVATEIDFMTTYIAGSPALIAAIVASPELEADHVEPTDGITWASDTINPPPKRS